MSETLRDGWTTTEDPRLGRIVQFDERSRDYPVTATIEATKPRSYTWRGGPVTDQGSEGSCVGHGLTGEMTARPRPRTIPEPDTYAYTLYHEIQHLDPWPGCSLGSKCPIDPTPDSENYGGTSTLTGFQELKRRGLVTEFRWAFGLDDLVMAIGHKGPAVLGIPWYRGMYDAPGGTVTISGDKVGGHCILARGVSVKRRQILLRNSWGTDWGNGGDAWISFDDVDRLLHEDGEACLPMLPKSKH